MTTPGQTAPDGSFTLGSGPFTQWGQNITESQVKALGMPTINPADPLGSLADLLMRLPLEALQFFQNFITDAVEGTWNTVTGAVNNILGWLVPRDIMVKLAELPGHIHEIFQQLVDALIAILGPIPIVGDVIENLANFLGLTNETAENAQSSADTANAAVALLRADQQGSGTVIKDDFDRDATGDLGTDYHRTASSGSGTWGTDGAGNVHGAEGGSASRNFTDRHITGLEDGSGNPSVKQGMTVVLSTPPRAAGGFGTENAQVELKLRCNDANDTCVMAIIDGPSSVEIGLVVSGVYSRFGASETLTQANGDRWEFIAGTEADDYEFVLLRNDVTVCSRVDGSHVSQLGTGYDHGALGAKFGTVVFFGGTFQTPAPDVQVLTIYDRTPA